MQPLLSKVDAVVFDCFGTLLRMKSYGANTVLIDSVLKHIPKEVVHEAVMTAPGAPKLLINLMGGDSSSQDTMLFENLMHKELSSIELFPDVVSSLVSLTKRGIKVGVCGNAPQPYAAVAQAKLRDYVSAFTWSSEVGAMKPDPLIFKDMLGKLGVEPARALMIGDSKVADIAGAENVGMHAALIHRGSGEGFHSIGELLSQQLQAEARPASAAWDLEAEAAKFLSTRRNKNARNPRPGYSVHR